MFMNLVLENGFTPLSGSGKRGQRLGQLDAFDNDVSLLLK
jgi:hypothetical protein